MLTVPSDVFVCWSFKQTTVRKKLLEHQFLKYYAIEGRVCPNVELRSNHLAVVIFFCGRRAGNLLDRHLNYALGGRSPKTYGSRHVCLCVRCVILQCAFSLQPQQIKQ